MASVKSSEASSDKRIQGTKQVTSGKKFRYIYISFKSKLCILRYHLLLSNLLPNPKTDTMIPYSPKDQRGNIDTPQIGRPRLNSDVAARGRMNWYRKTRGCIYYAGSDTKKYPILSSTLQINLHWPSRSRYIG